MFIPAGIFAVRIANVNVICDLFPLSSFPPPKKACFMYTKEKWEGVNQFLVECSYFRMSNAAQKNKYQSTESIDSLWFHERKTPLKAQEISF